MYKNLGLYILKNPKGAFYFVGAVPTVLAWESSSEEYINTALICGPGFARRYAEREGGTFKIRTFQTKSGAKAFAANYGITVTA